MHDEQLVQGAMTRRLQRESGFSLVAVMFLMLGMLALGLAIVALADTQTGQSKNERNREASFNLAEAALNARALQLGRSWPSSASCARRSTRCPT